MLSVNTVSRLPVLGGNGISKEAIKNISEKAINNFHEVLNKHELDDILSKEQLMDIFSTVYQYKDKWNEKFNNSGKLAIIIRDLEDGKHLERPLLICKEGIFVCFKKRKNNESKGEGSHKTLYLGIECNPSKNRQPETVALASTKLIDLKTIQLCDNEIQNHQALSDLEGVVRYLGHVYYNHKGINKNMMIVEYCENGNLFKAIDTLTPKQKAFITKQIFEIVARIHRQGKIIHRDLKPDNIFLDKVMNPKIGDFGCSTLIDKADCTLNGTPSFIAPEIWVGKEKCSIESDSFSLASTLIDMKGLYKCMGMHKPPFWLSVNTSALFEKKAFKHEFWKVYLPFADEQHSVDWIIYNMFNPDRELRWTVERALNELRNLPNHLDLLEKWFFIPKNKTFLSSALKV